MTRVLVIDDDEDVREITRELLEAEGMEVLLAETGASGLERARSERPDVILCDVDMPLLDGHRVLRALRQDETIAATPFVFLTGKAEKPDLRAGMELGADDYLTKPFTPEELSGAIAAQIKKKAVITARSQKALEELRTNIAQALPHELLTPLSAILGFASFLVEEAGSLDRAEIRRMALSIDSGAKRLHRMIGNVLFYAKLELMASSAERLAPLHGQTTPVGPGVAEPASATAARWGRQDDLRVEVGGSSVGVEAGFLRKIVEELVDNACKFSGAGSPVQVSGKSMGGSFTLTVADEGRGIAPERIPDIGAFMQFERKMYEQQGSGLGLAIVRRLAELGGGGFNLVSVPGKGTRVTVTLPAGGAD